MPAATISGAQAAVVELVEDGAAHELSGAVGIDAIEQSREEFAAEGFYGVDVLSLLLRHGEQTLVEFVLRERLIGLDEDDAGAGVRGLCRRGAAVTVGGGEVLDGFAADEEVFELAVTTMSTDCAGTPSSSMVYAPRRDLPLNFVSSGSSVTSEHVRQNARLVAGGVGAAGAGGGAHLGAVGLDVGDEEAGEDVGDGVSAEEDGTMVVLGGDDGRVAQLLEALKVVDDAFAKGGGALEVFGLGGDGAVVAAEAHAIRCLAAHADGCRCSRYSPGEPSCLRC